MRNLEHVKHVIIKIGSTSLCNEDGQLDKEIILKLIQQKYLGSYIRNFREHKAIPLHAKIISVSLIWITLSYCAIWTLPYIWARILFLIIAIGTTWHILSYKTLKR